MAKQKRTPKAERQRFYDTVVRKLGELGAVLHQDLGEVGCEFRLETVVGPLHLLPDKTDAKHGIMMGTVFGRFLDVERACDLMNPRRECPGRINPYSGKWNFHFSSDQNVDFALEVVFDELSALLPAEVGCDH